jgi:serine/threonine protein kinase/Tfp pilus assembly protein PilF
MLSPGERLGRYEILALAGSGGMGTVYRGRDSVLQREVAVKTISADGLRSSGKQRFMQEARAASSLNHPNIVTIYDIGDDRGMHFIAMEFVHGRTLDQLIAGTGIPWRDAIRQAVQIASALEAAHAAGIIHRDLKPTNVMITEAGVVKVLDFGLAKLTAPQPVNDDDTVTGYAPPTIEGTVLGTLAYMSPEQAESKPVDARSDIFSFGSVLYEALTGRRAFQGGSGLSTMAAILRDTPVPVSHFVRDIPPELQQIVEQCLEKSSDRRYQSMGDIKAALDRLNGNHSTLSSASFLTTMATLPCAASIAVLPFSNLSADKENEYFSDGLAEELINALAKVKGLRVTARTSAFVFRAKDQDIRAIGKALNVETVLEGSVRKAGNRVRINAQLIKASDGYHLWSERYDRELTDIFAIQDEISGAIVEALCEHLGFPMEQPERPRHTPDIEAYNALLRGRYHRFRFTPESWQLGRRASEQAVELDPQYAEAHSSLALLYIAEWALDIFEPKAAIAAARAAAERALALDNSLAEAQAVLATIRAAYEFDWDAAEKDFNRAFELEPNSPSALLQHAYWFLTPNGKLREARSEYRRVLESDPLSAFALFTIAQSYFFEGKFEQVIEYSQKALEIDPNYWPPTTMMANSYTYLGKPDRAREWIARALSIAPTDVTVRSLAASLQAMLGDPEPARRMIAELESQSGWARIPAMLAMLYDALGDADAAFRYAEEMIEGRSARAVWILCPSYRKLQAHPRYPELLRRMNLQGTNFPMPLGTALRAVEPAR